EAEAAVNRALAHDDVVLFVAGEIHEGVGKFGVADDAEVGLDAALEEDAGFGLAFGDDVEDAGLPGEEFEDVGGIFGGGQEVDVADNLAMAAQAAAGAATYVVGMGAEGFEEGLGDGDGVADEMARGVGAAASDAVEDVLGGLGAE